MNNIKIVHGLVLLLLLKASITDVNPVSIIHDKHGLAIRGHWGCRLLFGKIFNPRVVHTETRIVTHRLIIQEAWCLICSAAIFCRNLHTWMTGQKWTDYHQDRLCHLNYLPSHFNTLFGEDTPVSCTCHYWALQIPLATLRNMLKVPLGGENCNEGIKTLTNRNVCPRLQSLYLKSRRGAW